MTRPLTLRALAVLALIIMAEMVNGSVRALILTPRVGDFSARQISTLSACVLILLVAWACSPWLGAGTRRAQWAVGLLWVLLMMAFEVAVGRLVAGASWARLAADYDLTRGGLLGLGMVWLLCAPRLAHIIRQKWP